MDQIPEVLSLAAWPVILTDRKGVIARANLAAARLFGVKAVVNGANLPAICAPDDTAALSSLLAESRTESAMALKIRLATGTLIPFRLQCCPGSDGTRALWQFFKAETGAGPAHPAAKVDEGFLLQDAKWPVLLLEKNGQVHRANRAAVRAFGSAIEKADGTLASIWGSQNEGSARQFLSLPPSAAPVPLTFKLKSGLPGAFQAQLCPAEGEDLCLLQLLKEVSPEDSPASASQTGFRHVRAGRRRSGRGGEPGPQAKTGLRIATGPHSGAGFQQCADQHSGPRLVALEHGRAGSSVARLAQ